MDSLGRLGGWNPSYQQAVEEEEDSDWAFGDFGAGLKSASRTGGCCSAKDENDEDVLGIATTPQTRIEPASLTPVTARTASCINQLTTKTMNTNTLWDLGDFASQTPAPTSSAPAARQRHPTNVKGRTLGPRKNHIFISLSNRSHPTPTIAVFFHVQLSNHARDSYKENSCSPTGKNKAKNSGK